MVSAQTTYTSVSGNPCSVGRPAKAPQTPQNAVVTSAKTSPARGFMGACPRLLTHPASAAPGLP